MTLNNTPGRDSVSQRKAEVRKYSRTVKIAGGVGVVSLLGGLTVLNTAFFAVLVPLVMVGIIAYSSYKIGEIVNHKDQW